MKQTLEKYFNFSQFRPGQEEVVDNIMAGRDVVALMPTGGGKSLCYQLPAIMSDKLTIVISPLIALMKDQVDSLRARGISAAFLNSTLSLQQSDEIIDAVRGGRIKLLYIAPERFGSGVFKRLFENLDVYLFAVDEAHCVSHWGHDFRPDYLTISKYIKLLKKRPIVGAFTATATPEVKNDIIKQLEMQNPFTFMGGFNRPNLKFFVQSDLKKANRIKEVLRIVKTMQGSGIVYTITRKEAEETAKYLDENGVSAAAYHAGMGAGYRDKVQSDFKENRFKVIVATIAFGMGVDKADIRFVIHAGMPSSIEGYYQEAGRAGRDGETAYCILLHSNADSGLHSHFIFGDKQEMKSQGKSWDEINRVCDVKFKRLEKIKEYAESKRCRRKMILEYFSDPDLANLKSGCGGCDICINFQWKNTAANLPEEESDLRGTVMESVDLYQKGYSVEKIASLRSLGISTIFGHLTRWYLAGGNFDIEKYINPAEEKLILEAMGKVKEEEKGKLGPIKILLPENISYEAIRMVMARNKRINTD